MPWAGVVGVLVVALAACSDAETNEKLVKIDERLVELEETVDSTEKWVREIGKRLDAEDDSMSLDKVDSLAEKLSRIERKLDKLDVAARPAYPTPARARPSRPPSPDPAEVYAVPIADAPFLGAKNAKVTVIKAYEYACPFCERTRPTLRRLLADYKGDIKIVFKQFIVHPQSATEPAHAICAAAIQGKFEAMSELIWDKGYKAGRQLGRDHMETLAKRARLSMSRFRKDRDGVCPARVRAQQEELRRMGTRGTPAFFINGRFLSGARPIEQFKRLIDEELAKANDRVKSGTKVSDYYQSWVVDRGKRSL